MEFADEHHTRHCQALLSDTTHNTRQIVALICHHAHEGDIREDRPIRVVENGLVETAHDVPVADETPLEGGVRVDADVHPSITAEIEIGVQHHRAGEVLVQTVDERNLVRRPHAIVAREQLVVCHLHGRRRGRAIFIGRRPRPPEKTLTRRRSITDFS